jgi:hypothetical protein
MVDPIFCVVLADGPRWAVEAEWPDGTTEHIEVFKGYSQAASWVSARSKSWLRERKIERPQSAD